MTSYDLKSYALAVQLRSRKTLLVEGVTDKQVIGRIITEHELKKGVARQCVVDEVSLINREKSFAGLGNKRKVELTAAELQTLSEKFNWLVDREWEGIDLNQLPKSISALAPLPWGHRTKGHSIENYWLSEEALIAYLKMHHGSELPAAFFNEISRRFLAILRFAAAFSLVVQRLHAITACSQLICSNHVQWTGENYVPLGELTLAAANRGIKDDLTVATYEELGRADLKELSTEALRWICHGHLGEQVARTCAANIAIELGLDKVLAEKIERGFHATKLAHDADWLTRIEENHIVPLNNLVQWAV